MTFVLMFSGDNEIRTRDPLLARQVLSQLSYTPIGLYLIWYLLPVGLNGLEPSTSRLSGVRSNQLSYKPVCSNSIRNLSRQPPAFPRRLQRSIIGRLRLNHRVRDENGCVPQAHRHQKCSYFGFLHRRCALRITTSSLSFFLIYLFGKSTVMQPLLLPFP